MIPDLRNNIRVYGAQLTAPMALHIAIIAVVGLGTYWLSHSLGRVSSILNVRLVVFFASMITVAILLSVTSASSLVARWSNSVSDWLERRRAFRSNAVEEAPKFAIIRIIFGCLLTIRAFWLMYYMSESDWHTSSVFLPALLSALGAMMIATGLFTQLALVVLIVVQWQAGDALLRTSTLGNDVAAIFSTLLLFANAGAHLSFDAILRKRQTLIGRLVQTFYYLDGLAPDATLQIAKMMTLFAYWCVCVYSLGIHLGEPAWMSGTAGPLLLTNNFMSRYGSEFAEFFAYSQTAVIFARAALWCMLPWYLLIFPFVLWGGVLRAYVIAWGLLFFSLSLIDLRLGWLAEFEFLFFAALFWQKTFLGGPKTLQVAYDDRCNLCDRTVKFVKAVDIANRVDLKPLSKNQEWLAAHGIEYEDAQKDLYGVKTGTAKRAAKGYDFYLMLASEVLLLLPAYPLLVIGQYLGGRQIYRFIADRRTRIFGVCHLPTEKREHTYQPLGGARNTEILSKDPILLTFCHMLFLGICYLTTIPTPFVFLTAPAPVQSVFAVMRPFGDAAHVYGIAPINVFNHVDLRMTENWFTISEISPTGAEVLLPILDEDGKRLAAHRSDRIYFGNTVAFRRKVIGTTECEFENYAEMMRYLATTVSASGGPFLYRQYHQPLAIVFHDIYLKQKKTVVCEISFSATRP